MEEFYAIFFTKLFVGFIIIEVIPFRGRPFKLTVYRMLARNREESTQMCGEFSSEVRWLIYCFY